MCQLTESRRGKKCCVIAGILSLPLHEKTTLHRLNFLNNEALNKHGRKKISSKTPLNEQSG